MLANHPRSIKAVEYDLAIHAPPTIDSSQYAAKCHVRIQIERPTRTLTLNAVNIKINLASVTVGCSYELSDAICAVDIGYDPNKQRCLLRFSQPLPRSQDALLTLAFEGRTDYHLSGFYRSRYTAPAEGAAGSSMSSPEPDTCYVWNTQFAACDARRAFPCLDEPDAKATFKLRLEIPEDLVALSNMPVAETRASARVGHKWTIFQPTPQMSSYLLAWAVGDLEYVERLSERRYGARETFPVRVYCTKGLRGHAMLALEAACKFVTYFAEVFGVDYPLPKLDLLVVHELSHAAMENWGLLMFRASTVLYDQSASDPRARVGISYAIAHELAHQWFGNLVTMRWWNELWLNEGFATWSGWLAVDHHYPEWNVWGQFTAESMQMALKLDSLDSSHPIDVPIYSAMEVEQVTDDITYLKPASVIRMIAQYLGVEQFLAGISSYLNTHQYSNATAEDLWHALGTTCKCDVSSLADPWIRRMGFPVIRVDAHAAPSSASDLRQSRFSASGSAHKDGDTALWQIPLWKKSRQGLEQSRLLFATQEMAIPHEFDLLNGDGKGFYHTHLPASKLAELHNSGTIWSLSPEDRICLVTDIYALAAAGMVSASEALAFTAGFGRETSYFVWLRLVTSLEEMQSVFSRSQEVNEGLRAFTANLVAKALTYFGWSFESIDSSDFVVGRLICFLLRTAGLNGQQEVIMEVHRRFEYASRGHSRQFLPPLLRYLIFAIHVRFGGREAFEAVKKRFVCEATPDGKNDALQAMGQVQTEDLAFEYLEFAFGDSVATQDIQLIGDALGKNPQVRDSLWEYMKTHWPTIRQRLSSAGNGFMLERFLKAGLQEHTSVVVGAEVEQFFQQRDTSDYDRGLALVKDSIGTRAKYYERDKESLRCWLAGHGFLGQSKTPI